MSSGAWRTLQTDARSSWSRGQSTTGSSRPVITGLNDATERPRDAAAAQIAAASTVLPTPVSVPVTKTPRMRRGRLLGTPRTLPARKRGERRSGGFGEAVEDARAVGFAQRLDRHGLRAVAYHRAHRGGQHCGRLLKFGPSVRCHDGQPKAGGSFGDRRGPDRLREYPFFEGAFAHPDRAVSRTDDKREHLSPGAAGGHPVTGQRLAHDLGVPLKAVNPPRFLDHQVQRGTRSCDGGR